MTAPDLEPPENDQGGPDRTAPRVIPATAIIHQEGVIAVIAVVALSFREGGLLAALASPIPLAVSLTIGVTVGAACYGVLWLVRGVAAIRDLEGWQRGMVSNWTAVDIVVVALVSGLAEEALVRALLQPILGLVPAAMLFAVLHIVPDRRLWLWPVLALGLGVVLGMVFERAGYPAAAVAHIVINGLSLSRLRRPVAAG